MIGPKRPHRRTFLTAGSGAVAGLVLTPRATQAQASRGHVMQPISMASIAGDNATTLTELMKSQGFAKKYDLEADYVSVSDGSKIVAAVVSGSTDICRASGFDQTLAAISKGAGLKIIGGACVLITQAVYTSKPDIKTLKDLEGRVVGAGATGALLHHYMVALLRKHGVDVDKVRFVNVGSSTEVFRAVAAGTVDAGPGQISVYDQQDKYKVHSISDVWTELPEYPYQGSYAGSRAIQDHRDLMVRALASFQELYNFIQSDTSEGAYVEAGTKVTGEDPARTAAQWRFYNKFKPFSIVLPEDRIRYLQQLNIDTGVQKSLLPTEQIADLSLAQDALKLVG